MEVEEVTESREEMPVFEEQPDVLPQRIRRLCDRLTYYVWGSSLPSISQINYNRIPQTMGVPPYPVLYVPVTDPMLSFNLSRCHPYLCNPNTCRYQRRSCYYYRCWKLKKYGTIVKHLLLKNEVFNCKLFHKELVHTWTVCHEELLYLFVIILIVFIYYYTYYKGLKETIVCLIWYRFIWTYAY